jgi:hypothetical protein
MVYSFNYTRTFFAKAELIGGKGKGEGEGKGKGKATPVLYLSTTP